MSYLRTVWLVMQKDLLIEIRSREILYTTGFFAVACVLVFAFGFVREGEPLDGVAAGVAESLEVGDDPVEGRDRLGAQVGAVGGALVGVADRAEPARHQVARLAR